MLSRPNLSRRGLILAGGAAALAGSSLAGCSEKVQKVIGFGTRMVEIIKHHGGKVGVSCRIGSAGGDNGLNIQSDDRFAMCSTFKWVLAANILQLADGGALKLDQAVKYGQGDLLDYAPVTKANVGKGRMTVAELCSAAVSKSDNTAANLLLPLAGGPAGLTAFVRNLGDAVTRFDRTEPSLNTNTADDERDTTTPSAMTGLLQRVFTTSVLKTDSLATLKDWMVATETGAQRIRAGVPAGYVVGDKTGTGENGACNDVAVIWPPDRDGKPQDPIFLAIYTSGGTLDAAGREQTIADTTKLVFDTLAFVETLDAESESASS